MVEERLRVLVVDSSPGVVESLSNILSAKLRCRVDTAGDCDTALGLAKRFGEHYSVALIDYLLPHIAGGDLKPMGIDLSCRLKQHAPRMETIIMTRTGMDEGVQAMRAGALSYLTKPLDPNELQILVGKILQAKAKRHMVEDLIQSRRSLAELVDENRVLEKILHWVKRIGFDRVRLYVASEDGRYLVGRAHIGMGGGFLQAKRLIAEDA